MILEVQANAVRKPVGIIVDAVSEVLEIAGQDIEPSLNFGTDVRADFLLGIGKLESGFVLLLDVGRVLSLEQVDACRACIDDTHVRGRSRHRADAARRVTSQARRHHQRQNH